MDSDKPPLLKGQGGVQPGGTPGLTQEDVGHLSTLTLCSRIVAGMSVCVSCFPVPHLLVGLGLMGGGAVSAGSDPIEAGIGAMAGGVFTFVAVLMIGFYIAAGWAAWQIGEKLEQRKGFQFVTVASAILCLFMPLGTLLGVFTLIVINRPSVKAVMQGNDGKAI